MTDTTRRVARALLSVSDKTGLIDFANALAARGVDVERIVQVADPVAVELRDQRRVQLHRRRALALARPQGRRAHLLLARPLADDGRDRPPRPLGVAAAGRQAQLHNNYDLLADYSTSYGTAQIMGIYADQGLLTSKTAQGQEEAVGPPLHDTEAAEEDARAVGNVAHSRRGTRHDLVHDGRSF